MYFDVFFSFQDGKTIDLNSYNNFLTYNDKSNNRWNQIQSTLIQSKSNDTTENKKQNFSCLVLNSNANETKTISSANEFGFISHLLILAGEQYIQHNYHVQ